MRERLRITRRRIERRSEEGTCDWCGMPLDRGDIVRDVEFPSDPGWPMAVCCSRSCASSAMERETLSFEDSLSTQALGRPV